MGFFNQSIRDLNRKGDAPENIAETLYRHLTLGDLDNFGITWATSANQLVEGTAVAIGKQALSKLKTQPSRLIHFIDFTIENAPAIAHKLKDSMDDAINTACKICLHNTNVTKKLEMQLAPLQYLRVAVDHARELQREREENLHCLSNAKALVATIGTNSSPN